MYQTFQKIISILTTLGDRRRVAPLQRGSNEVMEPASRCLNHPLPPVTSGKSSSYVLAEESRQPSVGFTGLETPPQPGVTVNVQVSSSKDTHTMPVKILKSILLRRRLPRSPKITNPERHRHSDLRPHLGKGSHQPSHIRWSLWR